MQTSQKKSHLSMSNKICYQSALEIGTYCLPQFHTLDCYPSYCTLESSSASGGYAIYNPPSTISFSSDGSPVSLQDSVSYPPDVLHSPDNTYASSISGSCVTDDANDFLHKLRELENVMLGPDSDISINNDRSFQKGIHVASPGTN